MIGSAYYSFFSEFLLNINIKYISITINWGVLAEMGFLLLVPLAIKKFGLRKTMILGLVALTIRYLSFYAGGVVSQSWMYYIGILIHGLIFGFFYVGGQIYIDKKTPAQLKSQAQGFIFLITFGVGLLVGNFLCARLIHHYNLKLKGWLKTIFQMFYLWKKYDTILDLITMNKKTAVFLTFCISVLTLSCREQPPVQEKPNVLMICIDDLNDWLGCLNGHPNARTPNLDRLAAQGVLFANAHCQAPLCGPSRASLMTGLRPSTTGIYGMIDDDLISQDNPFTEGIIFLPEYFKNNGYHTMGIGKIFHEHAPEGVFDESGGRVRGFGPLPDERFVWSGQPGKEGYSRTSTDWGAFPEADSLMPDYQSAQWAMERLNRDYNQPFFLAVGFLRPHVPWYVPQKWFDLHPLENIKTPPYLEGDLDDLPAIAREIDDMPMMPTTQWAIESGEWPKMIQAYLACISFVDFYVGEILTALENSQYAENTVVVLWSDHGYRMGEKGTFAKHCLWEEATNAPLIFAGPGIQKGKTVQVPAEMLSIYPTLLDLCGLDAYQRNEGVNLAPLLRGETETAGEFALTTYGWGNHGVRTKNFRYIRYNDGSEEFYNHTADPNEWDNLAQKTASENEMENLKKFLPEKDAPYAKHSVYNFNPYFANDKLKHSK